VKPKAYIETGLGRKLIEIAGFCLLETGIALAQDGAGGTTHGRSRYLPANLVKAGSLRLGRVSVRTSDDQEIGKLLGFMIDAHRIRSLVVESDDAQLELPMTSVQLDAAARSLRIVQAEDVEKKAFSAEFVA